MIQTISYAQNKEDVYINWLLQGKKHGFYVDIGASDPVHHSVTKYFYDRGWRGINVDPIKRNISNLMINRPKDINLQMGIGSAKGNILFREYPGADGLSTFSEKMKDEYKRKYVEYEVQIEPLKDVLDAHVKESTKIDFLKIDVEGLEHEVIISNNWEKYSPALVIVEANHIFEDWHKNLQEFGYSRVFFDGLNEYFMKSSDKELKKIFTSYPEYVIGPMPLYYEHILMVENLEKHSHDLELMVQAQRNEINDMHTQLVASKKVRVLVKKLIVAINLSILARIEKLNKYKVKQQEPIQFTEDINKYELLTLTRNYDLDRYYQAKTGEPILYRTLLLIYNTSFKLTKLVAVFSIKIARRIKNG